MEECKSTDPNYKKYQNYQKRLAIAAATAARVRFRAFGDSSLDFELLVWVRDPELRGRIRHDLLKSIYKAFNAKGVEIPFPQHDLHVKEMPK